MILTFEENEFKKLQLSIADITCFVAGLRASQGEYENKFDVLIDAVRDLQDLNAKMKALL